MPEQITVTTTPATVLRHAVELAEPGPAGETRWDAQARTLAELGYAIVGKDDVARWRAMEQRAHDLAHAEGDHVRPTDRHTARHILEGE